MCQEHMVNDAQHVFDDWLSTVSELLDEKNYDACATYTDSLTKTFYHLEYQDGILAAEVLVSIFFQVDHILNRYTTTDEFRNKVHSDIKNGLETLRQEHQNKGDLYGALKRLRYLTTKYQLEIIKFPSHNNEEYSEYVGASNER